MILLLYLSVAFAQVVLQNRCLPGFSSSIKYFEQSIPSIPPHEIDYTNFGLLSNYTFSQVVASLKPNEKLFLLQRHQQGWHNVAPSYYSKTNWTCYWSLQEGNGEIEWFDAELTPKGIYQGKLLGEKIANSSDFPNPDSFYVSPLRRCLQTWDLTWGHKSLRPTIIENARETYGIDTESKRHNKTFIHQHWPYFRFEHGFTENDEWWSSSLREKAQHVDYRAALLLFEMFETDDKVISIVMHSGIMYAIMRVAMHRRISLAPGALLPIIITQEEYKNYPLNDPFSNFHDWCYIH